jgi:D-arabinose 1-dehydrogenase-like Zn-dependent alcohol dehydrogenase
VYDAFGAAPGVREVPDPLPAPDGVVVRVEATGLCRSDWHAWAGHDPGVRLPHVPGHELAGTVHAVGERVRRWGPGDRVTVPFVCGCGTCQLCRAGEQQVCPRQTQPGFTHWGSFAELVALDAADVNLVGLPGDLTADAAAGLGCRVATAFRAVLDQGRARPGEWVVVHGCGGVGLSAVMIAVAAGARAVAVDVDRAALDLAVRLGADSVVDASITPHTAEAVRDVTGGGAHVSLDAVGSPSAAAASVAGLRPRGRHVQVGLLPDGGGPTPLPMHLVVANELELLGSHGMPAHDYPRLLAMVSAGRLRPDLLVTTRLGLEEAGTALASLDTPGHRAGISVVDPRR